MSLRTKDELEIVVHYNRYDRNVFYIQLSFLEVKIS